MQWLEITIKTQPGTAEAVAAALTAGGFSDLIISDQQEFEEFLEQNRACWDYIDEALQQQLEGLSSVVLYLEEGDGALARLEKLVDSLRGRFGDLPMTVKPMEEENWEESWKDNYPPQPVGSRLLVLPCWLADTDPEGRLPVILDPGLTFGTGAHPSTQMVMEELETQPAGGSCLDLGSGSGILSIAALRLGARTAVGVDIDPKAEGVARENAALNGFGSPEFTACTGDVTADKALMDRLLANAYDTVLVNIVADVIIALSPVLPRFLSEHSKLILSGILDTRLEDVKQALYRAGLEITGIREKEEWRCVCARRSKA